MRSELLRDNVYSSTCQLELSQPDVVQADTAPLLINESERCQQRMLKNEMRYKLEIGLQIYCDLCEELCEALPSSSKISAEQVSCRALKEREVVKYLVK